MSRCLGARIADLADGRLDAVETERAFAHVAVCAGCRADLAAQRATSQRLAALADPSSVEPPSDLMQRLLGVPSSADAAAVPGSAPVPPQGGAGQRPSGGAGLRPSAGTRSSRPSSRRRRGRVALATAAGAAALAVVAVVGGQSALAGAVVPRPAIAPVVDTLTDEHVSSADQMPFSGPRIVSVGYADRATAVSPSPAP